ncbi:cation transport protein ChaC [Tistlia consotensis]|uniref:glutathione-specific gamma-glutamylcyclotransferase n=1 Tax=Tistlia consotensis USBA 355 TaxID=560819 RepID=A0A1Y6BAR2_9PROT|nr:gamma-glutamylcyclotransferase [Tistlia consotensis]SME90882.1 cation transport protein ChaC [Tistlia consotensis USBA 355]SNR26987.1 cation transport protein ChaC [Tistlia consotensis]
MADTSRGGRRAARRMALSADLVAHTIRPEPDLGPEPGRTLLTEAELDELARRYNEECGDRPFWVFAYGSLIWKPDFDAIAHQRATAYGWHRSFCMRMRRWRGSPEQPGLMMALERGGRCDGVIYRLPEEGREQQVRRVLFREVRFRETADMVRWLPVHTAEGRTRALTFWVGPKGERIASRLPLEEVAWTLARACGHVGSCAEYLFNTVTHLREHGIHDRNLWRLQELVAREIEELHRPS